MTARLYCAHLEYDTINYTYMCYLLSKHNFNFVLHIQLPPGFPREPPIIRLESVYHFTEDGSLYTEVLKNCPYNQQAKPRNMAEKIVRHVYNSVDEFINNSTRPYSYIN